ncbi:hypothetical protein PtB15_18B185 [Puccinia triticina]|nr:hypothetical protein PtB15_18B185 [Puccinia triticina]
MGRGGGTAICEIIRTCPLLESITIDTTFWSRCEKPLIEALVSRQSIKKFSVLAKPTSEVTAIRWTIDQLEAQLFSKWKMLEVVDLYGLHRRPVEMIGSIPKPIPVLNCTLRTLILIQPDLDERDLYSLLEGSRESIRELNICDPSSKLDRPGLFRILKECTGPDLESLSISIMEDWHHLFFSRDADVDDPAQNPSMLDILFKSSFGKIKFLSIWGDLASSKLFHLLPESLVHLRWGQCDAASFAADLFTWRDNKDNISPPPGPPKGFEDRGPWLPNLKTFDISDPMFWYNVTNLPVSR